MATSTPRFSELIRLPGARYGTVCCPKGIAIQTDCTVLVTDPGSNCIWKIDGDLDSGGGGLESDGSTAVTVFAGCPGQVGHADGPAKEALFESPEGIAICSDGTVYVGDIFSHDEDGRRMRLRAIDDKGQQVETCDRSYLISSFDGWSNCLDFGPDGHLYWAKGFSVDKLKRQDRLHFGAPEFFAAARYSVGPQPVVNIPFETVGQIKWTHSGNLYIADKGRRTVDRITGTAVASVISYEHIDRCGTPCGVAAGLDDYVYASVSEAGGRSRLVQIKGDREICFVTQHVVNDETQQLSRPGWMALDPIRNWLFFVDNDGIGLVLLFYHCASGLPPTPPDTLQTDLLKLLEDSEFSDVAFSVEGKEIKGCRAVLAARSTYFKSMFQSRMLEATQSVITVGDAKYDAFRCVLIHLHTGDTDLQVDPDTIQDVYTLSDRYQLDQLMAIARKKLVFNFTVENVVGVYRLATLHGDSALANSCIEMIARNVELIEEMDDFKQLDRDTRLEIYSSVIKCVKKRH